MLMWTIFLGAAIILWLYKLNKDYYLLALGVKRVKSADDSALDVPSPKGKTIFANVFDTMGMDSVAIFAHQRKLASSLQRSYLEYDLGICFYNIITAEDCEMVLTSQDLITKGIAYYFLEPFLGTGLLTSSEKKWHSRRKLLTPAFHFNILGQFEDIFKEESQKFIDSLKGLENDGIVSLSDIIPKFTLNTICETALGVKLDDCLNGENYRESFKMIEECFVKRTNNALYMIDWIFNIFLANKYKPHLETVHKFSSDIIEKRRPLFEHEAASSVSIDAATPEKDMDTFYKKKRYAMLDTLLHAEKDGLIEHAGICEEVDTFMFEGFDTTSMALIFALMNLSLYPEMQDRCYQEIIDNVDDDLTRLDISQINKLKYLECFVKETLRLYPSVPIIMRKAVRDTKLPNNLILPKETQIAIHIFDIQRSPKYFTNPSEFDPERFTPENSVGRHTYAFVPFSAGQRNCIGQKFAMLEVKTLLVYVLKNFKLLPLIEPKNFLFESGIIIRSKTNVKVKLVNRI